MSACRRISFCRDNRIFIALANRIGIEGDLTFTGMSLIADPGGDVLTEAPSIEEAAVTVDIDLTEARNKMLTPRNDALADRRPELYGELCRVK